jgi:hypothetical protein
MMRSKIGDKQHENADCFGARAKRAKQVAGVAGASFERVKAKRFRDARRNAGHSVFQGGGADEGMRARLVFILEQAAQHFLPGAHVAEKRIEERVVARRNRSG